MNERKPPVEKAPWYIRLAYALGYKPGSKEWSQTRSSTSKHARAATRPEFYAARKLAKTRRTMADKSRKINRRK